MAVLIFILLSTEGQDMAWPSAVEAGGGSAVIVVSCLVVAVALAFWFAGRRGRK